MAKLIDTHFHLDYYKNHQQVYESINKLAQYTLCMTNSPGIYVSCKKLYTETEYLKFALGFHPLEQTLSDKDFSDFLALFSKSSYIGEVGLDFGATMVISKEKQLLYFDRIVHQCADYNKLLSVHLRKSEDDAIKIIRKYRPLKCIIHWFNGTQLQMNELLNLDCYFSINENMIRTSAGCEKLKNIPSQRILVESDGPFTKVGTHKFSPELLCDAYEHIATALNKKEFIEQVFANFREMLKM